jgi:TorA maturation chaperone TorD
MSPAGNDPASGGPARGPGAGTAIAEEDQARANLYGLVSRLFYAPPDPNLLAEISRGEAAGESDTALTAAWERLREACQRAFPAVVKQEYDGLFIGVGKAQVTPYLSAYAGAAAPDRYLVRLREQLGGWGLARRSEVFEVEDHVSGVADVMRWLIEKGYPLAEQKRFFETFVYPGAMDFFAAVQKAPSASFFNPVAEFCSCFFDVEKSAFEMDADG